ncbi:MAG TPA: ATP-binding protein [Dehalococcoidia bacterium]|nr:ATP-binding protein [Dehalococcoidia bacterium]
MTDAVGRVGCPQGQEANVDEFYFWVAPGQLVEQTQIVRVPTDMGGTPVELFGVVDQVYRRSTISSMHMELAAHDGDPVADDLALDRDGVTYAKVRVVNAFPHRLSPPVEGSTVFSCGEQEAERAYEMDAYRDERGVCIGLIRNGGDATAGRAFLDQDFLLGAQAGHLNVNGAAGSGTKSSFLTLAAYQTINALKARSAGMTGTGHRPRIKTFIFNVKGFDLFWLDRWSTKFGEDDARVLNQMGVAAPDVFRSIAYYAPETSQRSGAARAIPTERPGEVRPYSWSLKDIIDFDLFDLLFSEETRANDNLVTLINWLRHRLAVGRTKALSLDERLGQPPDPAHAARRQLTAANEKAFHAKNDLNAGAPVLTFQNLLDYIEMKAQPESKDLDDDSLRSMSNSTIQALWRRLARVLGPNSGLLRRDDVDGAPLALATAEEDVVVIDIQSITDAHLQRFVIASALNQLVQWRSGPHAARHETFLVVIDELNRYAPRGASDAITRLFEYVASQMRSRGIILFGAQQQGSRVSDVVIENSQTRVLGRSGGQELADAIWRGFSEGDRKLALRLGPDEKVIVAPNFREALHVKVPRPPWAMRPEEQTDAPPAWLPGAKPAPGIASAKSPPSDAGRRKADSMEL